MNSLQGALYTQLAEREHPSGAGDRRAHASEAGKCARAIWYRIAGTPQTNPPPLRGLIAMEIGTQLHLSVQAALRRQYPDIKTEVYWEQGPVSGHADALYTTSLGPVVAEIKTASPFAWSYTRTPKSEHRLQASLHALQLEVPFMHIIYLNVGARGEDDPVREFGLPLDVAAAAAELGRLAAIATMPRLAPRELSGVEIEPDPTTYPCSWCPFLDRCIADGRYGPQGDQE